MILVCCYLFSLGQILTNEWHSHFLVFSCWAFQVFIIALIKLGGFCLFLSFHFSWFWGCSNEQVKVLLESCYIYNKPIVARSVV
jgi:hypothetical protein